MTDALIHLRVPAGLKARWVRESRAAGMRLTDWIVHKVEQEDDMCTNDNGRINAAMEWLRTHWTIDSNFYHLTEDAALDFGVSLPELQRAWSEEIGKK